MIKINYSLSMKKRSLLVFCLLLWVSLSQVSFADFLANLARPHEGRSMRATSTGRIRRDGKYDPNGEPNPQSNRDNSNVAPGQSKVLMDVKGPGVITHIWMTFLGPEPHPWAKKGSANHQEMLLRIYWDGGKRPGVEAPVGDFFANCFGKRSEVISLPVIVEDADSYNCFWHMPFRKSARIKVVNQSQKPVSLLYYNIDWIKKDKIPRDTPYFYAQYRQEYPVRKGEDYVVLDTEGKGHYVGTVLAVRTRSPAWFGEGDEKIYIDGEKKPSIWGTGNRWHITDPFVFTKGIKVTFEHYGWMSPDENPEYKSHSWNEREDDYSSVAFWYQTGEPTFKASAPHADKRRLPNLDKIFPARGYTEEKFHGQGNTVIQNLSIYPNGHLLYTPQSQNQAWLQIPFEVKKKEPQRLLLVMTRSYNFGKYQAYLNGIKIGEVMDIYSEEIFTREYHLLDFWPEPGNYTLRLECVGRNPQSTGYYLGIESVRLRQRRPRVLKYGHDKDKDWRKKPLLYK